MPNFALSEQIINRMREAENELGIDRSLRCISPDNIGIWQGKYHQAHMKETLVSHIGTYGVLSPIVVVYNQAPFQLGETNTSESQPPYLLIDGSKRLHACQILKKDIPILIKAFTVEEATALIAYDLGNKKNQEYGTAMQYHLWLKQKILSPQALVTLTGITLQRLNRLLSFIQLPDKLTESIGCMRHVSAKTASALVKMVSEESDIIDRLVDISQEIMHGASEAKIKNLLLSQVGAATDSSTFKNYQHRLRLGNTVLMECRANIIKLNERICASEDYESLVRSLEQVVKDWETNRQN